MSDPTPVRKPPSAGYVLRHAIWFGLITGVGAVMLLGLKKFGFGQVTLITPQVVWISPLTFVIVAVPAGAVLAGLGRLLPRLFDVRVIVFLLAAVSSACGLLVWGKEFNDLSVIILSLGIGVQFGQLARSKPAFFERLVRRTMPFLVAVPVLMAAGLNIGNAVIERRAVANLSVAPEGAPNVLLIILDTVRSLSTGLGDADRPTTPNLERFAATGITFEHAFSPTSWTLPSHASMFTGRQPFELSTSWTEGLDEQWPTLAEYLGERGYRTGGVVGNFFYCNSEWGLDRGFIHYQDYDLSLGHALLSTFLGHRLVKALEARDLNENFWFHILSGRRIAPSVRSDLLNWLDRDADRPWFAFVNFYDAHDPYVAPSDFLEAMAAVPFSDTIPVRQFEDGVLRVADPEHRAGRLAALRDYEASILYLDDQLGMLLSDMEVRGLLENTLVMITSDHGEEFGEHGRSWHGRTVYLPSIHVPLIVRMPDGSRAGERVGLPVSLTDLAASTVDVLGMADGSPFPGTSFMASVPADAARPPVYAEVVLDNREGTGPEMFFRSLLDDERHYIRSARDREEVYRYRADPLERHNTRMADSARLPAYRSILDQLIDRRN